MTKKIFRKDSLKIFIMTASLAMVATACSKTDKDDATAGAQAQAAVPTVPTAVVSLGSTELSSAFPATLKGKTDVEIRPQVAGTLIEVCVDEGQRVTKGQVLFRIDDVTLRAAVEQAKQAVNQAEAGVNQAISGINQAQDAINQAQAVVNSAQAGVNTAKTNEAAQKILYEKGIISKIIWQQASDQLAQAKAGLSQAQAGLAQAQAGRAQAEAGKSQAEAALSQARAAVTAAEKNLSYAVITAPSSGVVGSIPNRAGSYVSPQTLLTTVSDNSQMYAYFSLNENDVISLTHNGQISLEAALRQMPPVHLQLSNGTLYGQTGRVATVTGLIDSSTGAATVRALFPNPNGMLLSGASGSVLVPQDFSNVIIIPQSATFENQDMRMVYVVNDSNMTKPVPIQVEKLSDGRNFVVTSGLTPGERIVVDGVNTVVRGVMKIQPTDNTLNAGKNHIPAPTEQSQIEEETNNK